MKRITKKVSALICALALLLTTLVIVPITAFAAPANAEAIDGYKIEGIWADPENTLTQADIAAFSAGNKTALPGAVGIHRIKSNGNYYLFLPSNADCYHLKFWFTSSSAVTLNNITLTSGQPTDALAAIDAGGTSANYTLNIGSSSYTVTAIKSGDVGAVYIDTTSGSIKNINNDKNHTESGTIMVTQPDGTVDYDGALASMHGRGNASWDKKTKRPYSIKLDRAAKLLGMSKSKKWALVGNHADIDKSMLKNQIIYDFSDYIGIPYQVHCKPVDLYVNQQYLGTYQLTERIEIRSSRIDVIDAYENLEIANGTVDPVTGEMVPADINVTDTYSVTSSDSGTVGKKEYSPSLLEPSDVTGGYIFELEISERWVADNAGFCAYNGQGWDIKSCNYISHDMAHYCYDLLFALGGAVYNNGIVPSVQTSETHKVKKSWFSSSNETKTNPAPAEQYQGMRWSDLLDARSAVLYYWTQEYFTNLDASTTSTYFFKDSDSVDSKIYAGPVWDMDNAWNFNNTLSTLLNRWGHSCTNAQDWYAKNTAIYRWYPSDGTTTYTAGSGMTRSFYGALCYNCSDFWTMAEDYWYSTIEPATQILLGNAEDPTGTLHSVAYYTNAIETSATMNAVRHDTAYNAASVTSDMTAWLVKRNNWLNSKISTVSIENVAADAVPAQTFDGTAKTPSVRLTYNDTPLVRDVDYTLSYDNNVNVGDAAQITVNGIGRFTGSTVLNFSIVRGNVPNVRIDEAAYAGDVLEPNIAEALNGYVTYQWRVDGAEVAGETGSTYTVREGDVGKTVTLAVTGDGVNLNTSQVLSNGCHIRDGVRPTGYTVTIASWNYDYTANPLPLDSQNETGVYAYTATDGERAESATLSASIDAVSPAKIKWVDVGDEFKQPTGTLSKDRVPVIEPSSKNNIAWALYPYYEAHLSTKRYENITLSANMGGTKKGPAAWKVQYSLDGVTYTDVDGAAYRIAANKVMVPAFSDVALPAECDNRNDLYIRIIASEDTIISPPTVKYTTDTGKFSGVSAINNIAVKGSLLSAITSLDAPEITTTSKQEDASLIYSTDVVKIRDTNGGAPVYYSVNGSTPQRYEAAFNPFGLTAQRGDTATIEAYARFEDIQSPVATYTVTFDGACLVEFCYDNYPDNETNGTVFSTGGEYGKSGRMTAEADGVSQYPPLWNDSNKAFAVSPDDGLKWATDSGFTFEISTAGYTEIAFTCRAYTTSSGPKSSTLQYSLDGESWSNVSGYTNVALPTTLGAYMVNAILPAECSNQRTVYVRLATTENLTAGGAVLHGNLSKGNFYINNIAFTGISDGSLRMPYTEKSTSYFGGGAIEYTSPDGEAMKYYVTDSTGTQIASGNYPSEGIVLTSLSGFNSAISGPYSVYVWAGDGDNRSVTNARSYYYKGETVTAFKYNGSDRPFDAYWDADTMTAYNTAGGDLTDLSKRSKLSMFPNGINAAPLTYTATYGVKAEWATDNRFTATKNLDNPSGNGYWLMETSTEGYKNLTLNLEQLSSNKGPRDWGVAYSVNGLTYTYVDGSNARAISNDAYGKTVETYNNLPLPAACDDQAKLYLKIFINGGESVDGTELDDATVTKGNTGINSIELSGIPTSLAFDLTVTTVAMEGLYGEHGGYAVEVPVTVNGQSIRGDGTESVSVNAGDEVMIVANAGETFERTLTVTANSGQRNITVPVVTVDMNGDGIINAKDYAYIQKLNDGEKKTKYAYIFENLLNLTENTVTYP